MKVDILSTQASFLNAERLNRKTSNILRYALRFSKALNTKRFSHAIMRLMTFHEILQSVLADDQKTLVSQKFDDDKIFTTLDKRENIKCHINLFNNDYPLIHFYLINSEDGLLEVVIHVHHIIFDDYSLSVLLRHLKLFYYQSDLPIILYSQEKKRHYKQTSDLSVPTLAAQTKNQLPFETIISKNDVIMSKESILLSQVSNFKQQKTSHFFLAVFLCLLRYYGFDEVVISLPLSSRDKEIDTENIGCFVRMTTLSFKHMRKWNTFSEVISVVTSAIVKAKEPKQLNQLTTNIIFNWQFKRAEKINFEKDIYCHIDYLPNLTAKFDIGLDLRVGTKFIYGFWEFNKANIPELIAENFPEHFKQILNQLNIHGLNMHIKQFTFKHDINKTLASTWQASSKNIEVLNKHPVELIIENLSKRIDKIILQDSTGQYTGEDLARESNKVANFLQQQKIKVSDVIAIDIPVSFELVAILIGIWKVGAVSFLLDNRLPFESKKHQLTQSNTKLLFSSDYEAIFCEQRRLPVCQTQAYQTASVHPVEIAFDVKENMPLYIATSSGTTGKPKIFLLPIEALTKWESLKMIESGMHQANEALLITTRIGFDAALWDIYRALHFDLVLHCQDSLIGNHQATFYYAIENQITHMTMTPTQLQDFINLLSENAEVLSKFKIVTTGAKLPLSLAKAASQLEVDIYNGYGETEAGIGEILEKFKEEYAYFNQPLPGMRFYVLNDDMQILPLGVTGNLYVTGPGLLLKRLDLSDGIDDPHIMIHPETSERLLNTRMHAYFSVKDNSLQLIGRSDNAFKYHGQMLNTDMIENALLTCENIQQAIVCFEMATQEIHAYLALSNGDYKFNLHALIKALGQLLPPFALPHHYYKLTEVPKTARNKIDVAKLAGHAKKLTFTSDYQISEKVLSFVKQELATRLHIVLPDAWLNCSYEVLGLKSVMILDFMNSICGEFNVFDLKLYNYPKVPVGTFLEAVQKQLDKKTINVTAPKKQSINMYFLSRSERMTRKKPPIMPMYASPPK